MKKLFINTGFIAVVFLAGCTKNFDSINTDPTRANGGSFDPNLLLPTLEFSYANANAGYNGPILFQSMWTQTFASTSSGAANYYLNADKYVLTTGTYGYVSNGWNNAYTAAGYAYELQTLTADNTALANLNAVAKIMRVQSMQYLTDVYGDVPYSQGSQAKSGIFLPVYDKQELIYDSMFVQLSAAINQLDATQSALPNDAIYGGDIAKWKKYGYSLMLKLAMRLTKVNPAFAQQYAEAAAAGGTFTSVDDNAYLVTDNADGYGNANSSALLTPGDLYEVRWSKTFIDYLKTNSDPRLSVVAEVPQDGIAGNTSTAAGNSTAAAQMGLPNGYDLKGGSDDITTSPGYPGGTGTGGDFTPIGKYSRPKTSVYTDLSNPIFILTYAETELLLAEAKARGWNVGSTTAAQHYANGVSAGMQSLAAYGAGAIIDAITADAYAAAHPLDVSSLDNSLKQINEQYWATDGTLLNFIEVWCNWRRSGYPVLTPVNYDGNFSGGQIPRREIYPTSESTQNPANYQAAASSMGGDTWSSRVWWDKQ